MHFLLKCRKILLSNWFYVLFFLGSLLYVFYSYLFYIPAPPKVSENKQYKGTVTSKQEGEDYVLLETTGKINFQVYLSINHQEDKDFIHHIQVGSLLSFQGKIESIQDEFYLFYGTSYSKKLARTNLFYKIFPEQIIQLEQKNILFKIKEKIYTYLNCFPSSKAYLKTFLLGDQTSLSKKTKEMYQTLGISHLFALSGMHLSFIIGGLYGFLKKWLNKETYCFWISFCLLVVYALLVKQSPSIMRASFFFLLFRFNKLYDLHIKSYQLLLLILSCFLLLNPFILEEISFLYSFSIASGLVLFQKKLAATKKWKSLLKTSCFSFFLSLPITIYYQYQTNFLSILWNLFFIPFVSLIVFPLSFLVFICPPLEPIFCFVIMILEKISTFCLPFSMGTFIFMKVSIFYYLFLFCFFFFCLFFPKFFPLYFFLLFCHSFLFPYGKGDRFTMIDVGQGDCFLFESKGKALLLDTGGKEGRKEQNATFLLRELKARGIRKIEVLLSHGDQDHAGNVEPILQDFPVTFIGFNAGSDTETEKMLKTVAKDKKIPTQTMSEQKSLSLGRFSFVQLNSKWENENDSSAIYFVTYQDKTMLFLGDASSKVEKKILEKYQLPSLNLIKIAHHGSQTSTSEELLQSQPISFAFISSGRNNFYHHPSPSTINKLTKYHISIYNTQEVGSVEVSFPSLKVKSVLSIKNKT